MLTGKIQQNKRMISHDITTDFLSINYVDSWCPCLFSGCVYVVQHLFTFMEEFWDLSNPTRSHLGHPLHLHQLRDPNIAQPFHDSISIPSICMVYGVYIYIIVFSLALVEIYGIWRYTIHGCYGSGNRCQDHRPGLQFCSWEGVSHPMALVGQMIERCPTEESQNTQQNLNRRSQICGLPC